ncbi:accessory Sec system protein Asp2, partial [Staphylococcus warneri]|uniref:accessory Sec system protein Asp2 n=1 Tax=Staphylococcus warneri TaxID=1292 RepID=UPI003704A0D7
MQFKPHFRHELMPLLNWHQNLLYHKHKLIQLSPQFPTQPHLTLQYTFPLLSLNPQQPLLQNILLTHQQLPHPLYLQPTPYTTYISTSLTLKPNPTLHIPPLHK